MSKTANSHSLIFPNARIFSQLLTDTVCWIRNVMVKGNRNAFLHRLHGWLYDFFEYLIIRYLSKIPAIIAIYLTHSQVSGERYPGLSDFDLIVICETKDLKGFHTALRRMRARLVQWLPIQDVSVFTSEEFEEWQRLGGGMEPVDEVKHWRCAYGHDVRQKGWDLSTRQAERDRLRLSLMSYLKLITAALKEEPVSSIFSIIARRELYKGFCFSLFHLYPEYLQIPRQRDRIVLWNSEHGPFEAVDDLIKTAENRFQSGHITNPSYEITALAFQQIDQALKVRDICFPSALMKDSPGKKRMSPRNYAEVLRRTRQIADSISQLLEHDLEAIFLSSNGSPRGYVLVVVLKDNLTLCQIGKALRNLHIIFRVYDDSWFNEHFPAKAPLVYSKRMLDCHLEIWPFVNNFALRHGSVLYGNPALYQESLASSSNFFSKEDEIKREILSFSMYKHQIYIEHLKVGLYDAVTLHYPRLFVFKRTGWAPSNAEEAVLHYSEIKAEEDPDYPIAFLKQYGNLNVDRLTKNMGQDAFEQVRFMLESNH
ncbi:MAG: hypothetical protein JSV96_12705 [Candidatus Aminicenantes bacterium]|nr:MAG: hypothetical protein JSV96_12705 [Candidatus Aminicenantes bacterium]